MKEKEQKATAKALGLMKMTPFTRAVYLTGSYAENRATKNSDIDFFLQVSPNHIWTARFLSTLILAIFGLRRTNTKIAGKICLNWVAVSTDPLLNSGRQHALLWREDRQKGAKQVSETLLCSRALGWIERSLKKYQIKRLEKDKRTRLPGSAVRYSDAELGFHPPKNHFLEKM